MMDGQANTVADISYSMRNLLLTVLHALLTVRWRLAASDGLPSDCIPLCERLLGEDSILPAAAAAHPSWQG